MSPLRLNGSTTSQRTAGSVAHENATTSRRGAGASGGGERCLVWGRGAPHSSRHGGGAELAEADREERIEQRRGGDERRGRALAEQVIRTLDGGDATDAKDRAIPGPGLSPRQHLFDL